MSSSLLYFSGTKSHVRTVFKLLLFLQDLDLWGLFRTKFKQLQDSEWGSSFHWTSSHHLPMWHQLQSAWSALLTFQCDLKWCCTGIYQSEGVIEAGKKLPIVDVGSAFYPNMVRSLRKIPSQWNQTQNIPTQPRTDSTPRSCSTTRAARTRWGSTGAGSPTWSPSTPSCPGRRWETSRSSSKSLDKHWLKDADKCQKVEINPNVKVTDCYGLHHLSTLKEERAPAIQKGFLFTCTCQVAASSSSLSSSFIIIINVIMQLLSLPPIPNFV